MNPTRTQAGVTLYLPQITRVHQVVGALRFPVFLLVWSLGVTLLAGGYYPADALVRQAPLEFAELAQVPALTDSQAFASSLETQLQQADVTGGRWHPQAGATVEPKQTVFEKAVQPAAVALPVAVMDPPTIEPQLLVKQSTSGKSDADSRSEYAVEKQLPAASSSELWSAPPVVKGRTLIAKREARTHLAAGRAIPAYQLLFAEMAGGAKDTEYLGLFAVAAYASGRPAEALLVYERLLNIDPDNERWSVGLGLCRERLGMDAAQVYQKVLAQAAGDSPVHTIARARLRELG